MARAILDIRNAAQARELLFQLEKREKAVVNELDKLLEQQTQLDIKMASFQHMLPNLHTLSTNATQLNSSITQASHLAESVSSKVRVLDQAKSHVYATMRQVDDVIDLKSCVDGVQYCMNSGDFEMAAAHINRYLSLDQTVFQESSVNPSIQDVSSASSFKLLKQNEDELKQLVRSKFKEAVGSGDSKSVERFLKIYPLLNLHEEGLEGLCPYLCAEISSRAEYNLKSAVNSSGDRSGLVFADVLTQLFEDIAGVLEKYQVLVEKHYGTEWISYLVQHLQNECDGQVQKVLKLQREERSLENKVNTVSMALKSRAAIGAIRPDVLELDLLLTELSLCSSRCELYFRFLCRKLSSGKSKESGVHDDAGSHLLSRCGTTRAMQELIGKYIMLENYFMSESLSKAVRMDHWSPGAFTSSMTDDIFFVLQKCIKRAFASSNVNCTCAMLNHARALLEEDYREVLESRVKASLPTSTAPGLDLSSILQGRLQSRSSGTDNETNKPSCMVALNDVEVSIENIQKLTKDLEIESGKLVTQVGGSAGDKLQSCLADFSSSVMRLNKLKQEGVSSLLEMVIMPRIRPSLDTFKKLEHVLTEEKLANYEVNDPFVHQLVVQLQSTLGEVKEGFLQHMYDQVALDTIVGIASYLEQLVMESQFNQLGGLQLDRDLRCLLGYLSSLTPWPVRDKFARLSQIATILSLETVREMLEYWGENTGSLVWRLTPGEVKDVMSLRNDFTPEEITKLKL